MHPPISDGGSQTPEPYTFRSYLDDVSAFESLMRRWERLVIAPDESAERYRSLLAIPETIDQIHERMTAFEQKPIG
jgi:hypothetical protein